MLRGLKLVLEAFLKGVFTLVVAFLLFGVWQGDLGNSSNVPFANVVGAVGLAFWAVCVGVMFISLEEETKERRP